MFVRCDVGAWREGCEACRRSEQPRWPVLSADHPCGVGSDDDRAGGQDRYRQGVRRYGRGTLNNPPINTVDDEMYDEVFDLVEAMYAEAARRARGDAHPDSDLRAR